VAQMLWLRQHRLTAIFLTCRLLGIGTLWSQSMASEGFHLQKRLGFKGSRRERSWIQHGPRHCQSVRPRQGRGGGEDMRRPTVSTRHVTKRFLRRPGSRRPGGALGQGNAPTRSIGSPRMRQTPSHNTPGAGAGAR
jgi:hypothetical protein